MALYGPIDYERLRELKTLAESLNVSIGAGSTLYLPSDLGVDISRFKFKTVTMKADYALNYAIQVSDDRLTWDDYDTGTLTANKMLPRSFEEDFNYVRVALTNPDTSAAHTINYVRIKGRRL